MVSLAIKSATPVPLCLASDSVIIIISKVVGPVGIVLCLVTTTRVRSGPLPVLLTYPANAPAGAKLFCSECHYVFACYQAVKQI